jgi:RNA polymerase subunit RPABC4/transcription elongation factor Spt4
MRKLLLRSALSVLTLTAATALFAVTAKDAPEKITIQDCQSKKPAVVFPHAAHFEVTECSHCHHTQADLKKGGTMEVQACRTCHVTPEKAETPICSQMSMTKNPFHMVCITCHKEQVAKNASSKAPTKCDGCHVKS